LLTRLWFIHFQLFWIYTNYVALYITRITGKINILFLFLGPSYSFDILQWIRLAFFFLLLAVKARELDRRGDRLSWVLVQCQKGDGKERTNKNKLPLTDKTTLNRSRITTQLFACPLCIQLLLWIGLPKNILLWQHSHRRSSVKAVTGSDDLVVWNSVTEPLDHLIQVT
jgi:hypothetical protein